MGENKGGTDYMESTFRAGQRPQCTRSLLRSSPSLSLSLFAARSLSPDRAPLLSSVFVESRFLAAPRVAARPRARAISVKLRFARTRRPDFLVDRPSGFRWVTALLQGPRTRLNNSPIYVKFIPVFRLFITLRGSINVADRATAASVSNSRRRF